MTYIFFYVLTLIATGILILIGASVGSFLVKLGSTIIYTFLRRKLSIFGYQWFYTNKDSMENDERCMYIYPVLKELYIKGSNFNSYFPRLSGDRLPLNVVMNWARSVAEDLFFAPIPSVKIDHWNHYWKSKLYARVSFFHSDFPEYEEYEMGCIWGVVFLWLIVNYDKHIEDPLMNRIKQLGCNEKTAVPYFMHCYDAARKHKGGDYHLTYKPQTSFNENQINNCTDTEYSENITPEDIYCGFESLSVNERCNARRVLNDLLADCNAWKLMLNEMKRRGWFKDTIYKAGDTIIKGDYIKGDKVKEKNIIPDVGNFKPQIQTQTMNLPFSPIEQGEQNLLEDE